MTTAEGPKGKTQTASANYARVGGDLAVSVFDGLNEAEVVNLLTRRLGEEEVARLRETSTAYLEALRKYEVQSYLRLGSAKNYVPLRAKGDFLGATDIASALQTSFRKNRRQIFITGSPGAGKSTLLRHLAHMAWDHPEECGLDQRHIALPLRLRFVAESSGSSLEEKILGALARANDVELRSSQIPNGFLDNWSDLLKAPWLFLIDGLDEVASEKREEALRWVERLVHEGRRVVLTSRPVSFTPRDFDFLFSQFEILPFTRDEQAALARSWIPEAANAFLQEWARFSDGELGGTPLLLTIAMDVFRRGGRLPRKRSELYREFVAECWKEGLYRGKEDLGEPLRELAPLLLPLCLRQIAVVMTDRKAAGPALDFAEDAPVIDQKIREVVAKSLGVSSLVAESRANALIAFLGSHSGVFVRKEQEFEWLHPTFREFLAAEAIAREEVDIDLSEALARSADPAWRQIALFLLSIVSEKTSAQHLLEQLLASRPDSRELVGVAIAEGVDVAPAFAAEQTQRLADSLKEMPRGNLCERLLDHKTTSVERLRTALLVLSGTDSYLRGYYDALANYLAEDAVRYGERQSAAIEDLQGLHAVDTLLSLARDEATPFAVCLDAVNSLFTLRETGAAESALFDLLSRPNENPKSWSSISNVVAKAGSAELYAKLGTSGIITDEQWRVLLTELDDSNERVLADLIDNFSLTPSQRDLCRVRATRVADDLVSYAKSTSSPGVAEAAVALLARRKEASALLEVIQASQVSASLKLVALRALIAENRADELRKVVAAALPYGLRRRAAEKLYNLPNLDEETASLLSAFFEERPKKRTRLLDRRLFCKYRMGDVEATTALCEEAFHLNPNNSWRLGIYGDALDRLARSDDALVAFDKALEIGPWNAYARARRASICLARSEIDRATQDVLQLSREESPTWFWPTAAEILHRIRRLDDAQNWIDYAIVHNRDRDSKLLIERAKIWRDGGKFDLALADLQTIETDDPWFEVARLEVAILYRITEQHQKAYDEYADILSRNPEFLSVRSALAEMAIVLNGPNSKALVEAVIEDNPDEPYYRYQLALCEARRGDAKHLRITARNLLATDIKANDEDPALTSNKVLYNLAVGLLAEAQALIGRLVSANRMDILASQTVPELVALSSALPADTELRTCLSHLRNVLWPTGVEMVWGDRPSVLRRLKEGVYPFPIYCQLAAIGGLEEHGELGKRILYSVPRAFRCIVIMSLQQPERIFGQCNFKMDESANYELKFCDGIDTMLSTNLAAFIEQYDVSKLMFFETDLKERFDKAIKTNRFAVETSLVRQ